jgi:hypothetical protein
MMDRERAPWRGRIGRIGLYPNPELKGVAQEVETTLMLIMDEAAR